MRTTILTKNYSYSAAFATSLLRQPTSNVPLSLLTHVSLAVLLALVVFFAMFAVQQFGLASFAYSSVVFNLLMPLSACILAVCVFVLSNPMHALLSLVGVFLATITFYVYAGIEFIGLVTLIVYVGAVAILFLFVIMLLNVKSLTAVITLLKYYTQRVNLGFGAALVSVLQLLLVSSLGAIISSASACVLSSPGHIFNSVSFAVTYRAADVNAIADLYTTHSVLFWLTTANLLLALLGSIILAMSTTEQPRFVANSIGPASWNSKNYRLSHKSTLKVTFVVVLLCVGLLKIDNILFIHPNLVLFLVALLCETPILAIANFTKLTVLTVAYLMIAIPGFMIWYHEYPSEVNSKNKL